MKSLMNKVLAAAIAMTGAFAAHAQTVVLRADVPFGFYMGKSAMPADSYKVTSTDRGSIWVQARSSNANHASLTHPAVGNSKSEAPRLVFHRYGDTYFLTQIWTGDPSSGQALPMSPIEKELASNGTPRTLAVIQLAIPR
jgi:hypothetical protein